MSKETDIAISVTVKDGPKTQPQATKLPKDCGVNLKKAINEELVIDCDKPKAEYKIVLPYGTTEKLLFVAIHADRYKYKDTCGKEQSGIIYADTAAKLVRPSKEFEYLDGPHVYVWRRLQPLTLKELYFGVCKELFSCVTERDKKKVVINVTFGVGELNEEECPECNVCKSPDQGKAPLPQHQQHQQQYPPAPVPALQN